MNDIITSCESEQLHLSGAIQAHGAMLVASPAHCITHVSANIGEFLHGATPAGLLGTALPEPMRLCAEELSLYAQQRKSFVAAIDSGYPAPAALLDLVCNRSLSGETILELTRTPAGTVKAERVFVRPMQTPDTPAELDALLVRLADEVFEMSGFDRVFFHRFAANGDGEVVYERKRPGLGGDFQGLRFPASDIPQIARNLYVRNPWRLIPDAQIAAVPILALDGLAAPDLGASDLRSVSPLHVAYMANMGVRASLSLPVVGANTLVALVVAHHAAPRALPTGILEQLAARTLAFALASLGFESRRRIRLVDGLSSHFRDFDDLRRRQGDFVTAWGDFAPSLLKTFEADGIALVIDGTSLFFGPRPLEPEALAVLDDWFSRHEREQVWYSDSLSRQLPEYPLSATAGALALRASTRRGPVRVYFNRLEHVHEVAWGGNPNKPFETVDGGLQVSPRRSFEKWVEKRLGYSRPWGNECKLLALALRQLLV